MKNKFESDVTEGKRVEILDLSGQIQLILYPSDSEVSSGAQQLGIILNPEDTLEFAKSVVKVAEGQIQEE